jgi:hypothetical protein
MEAAVTNALDEVLHTKLHGVNPQGSGFTPCCHIGEGSLLMWAMPTSARKLL